MLYRLALGGLLALVATLLSGCDIFLKDDDDKGDGDKPKLESLFITPPLVDGLPVGNSQAFEAFATFTDKTVENVTNQVEWTSSDPTVLAFADPDLPNVAEAVTPGTVMIMIEDPETGAWFSLPVTVIPPEAVSISIFPQSIPGGFPVGATRQLQATAVLSNNTKENLNPLVSELQDAQRKVTWGSTDEDVAQVNERGEVLAVGIGSAIIFALVDDAISHDVPVDVGLPEVVDIEVTPRNPDPLVEGIVQPFSATVTWDDGATTVETLKVTWTSDDPQVADFEDQTSAGVLLGKMPGETEVTATFLGVSSEPVPVEVIARQLVRIDLEPDRSDETLAAGEVLQYRAIGVYNDDSRRDITESLDWSSNNPSVVNENQAIKGQFQAIQPGDAVIRADDPNSNAQVAQSLTVGDARLVNIQIEPGAIQPLVLESRVSLKAIGIYTDDGTRDLTTLVTWRIGNEDVAVISNEEGSEGVLAATGPGITLVFAIEPESDTQSRPVEVEVLNLDLAGLNVKPRDPNLSLPAGRFGQLTCSGVTDIPGSDIQPESLEFTERVTWESLDPDIAVVSNKPGEKGQVFAKQAGEVRIKVTDPFTQFSNGGAYILTVTETVLGALEVEPEMPQDLPQGRQLQFRAVQQFGDGTSEDVTDKVQWRSSNRDVAPIGNSGVVRGIAFGGIPGSTDITAFDPEREVESSPVTLNVVAAELESLNIFPQEDPDATEITLVLGDDPETSREQLVAQGRFSNNTFKEITTRVTWISNNPGVAVVSNALDTAGVVTGIIGGVATVKAKDLVSGVESADITVRVTDGTPVVRIREIQQNFAKFEGQTVLVEGSILGKIPGSGGDPDIWILVQQEEFDFPQIQLFYDGDFLPINKPVVVRAVVEGVSELKVLSFVEL